jgi:Cu/Ag efflux pump CusA
MPMAAVEQEDIGGIISATILSLSVLPVLYRWPIDGRRGHNERRWISSLALGVA